MNNNKELSSISIDSKGNLFIVPTPNEPYYIIGFTANECTDNFIFSPVPLK